MKDCTHCKHAEWERTSNGRLSPTGNGKCAYQYKLPPIPASMFWLMNQKPSLCGGSINRRKELSEHCAYWERA